VEGNLGGFDVGEISLSGEAVRLRMRKKNMQENDARIRSLLRVASEMDLNKLKESRGLEKDTLVRARAIIREMNLDMKLGDVEYQGDGRKATFFYTAEGRVDFRELIKVFNRDFRVKIEMKQIGARQEAGRIGGIGVCGRELCCSTWLTDFKSVVTQAARYQNLSINQQKLSGQCGRLKCCLNYELDSYMEALEYIPENAERLETENGTAYLQRVDIFKKLMWYQYEKSSVFHPVHVDRVRELLSLNRKGIKPPELGAEKLVTKQEDIDEKPAFTELTGQVTLDNLRKTTQKKKKRDNQQARQPNQPGGGGNKPQGQPGDRPQQQNRPQGDNRPNRDRGNRPNRPNPNRNQGNRPQNNTPGNTPPPPKED
jgi:cell fate regulator YaaT (PSP1 superfamily)